ERSDNGDRLNGKPYLLAMPVVEGKETRNWTFGLPDPAQPIWLRVERQPGSNQIRCSSSRDGTTWKQNTVWENLSWPGKVKVGVVAVNATSQELVAQLEAFE